MIDEEVLKAIGRRLVPNRSLEEERIALSTMPESKRQTVAARILVLDAYLSIEGPTAADFKKAAAQLGSSERQVYRLLTRLRQFGPVKGLVPHLVRTERKAGARGGLMEPAETALKKAFKRNPNARISELEAAIHEAYDGKPQVTRPTQYSIRQRVLQMRAEAQTTPVFGERLVLDQAKINLPIRVEGLVVLPTITLLIDAQTRLIAGAGLTVHLFQDFALMRTLVDFDRERGAQLKAASIEVAEKLRSFTWIVTPDLEDLSGLFGNHNDRENRPSLQAVSEGVRRHGSELLKLIGDRLGPYELHTRQPFTPEAPVVKRGAGVDFEEAEKLVSYCVEAWNAGRLAALRRAHQPADLRAERLEALYGQVCQLFEPIFHAIHGELQAQLDRS